MTMVLAVSDVIMLVVFVCHDHSMESAKEGRKEGRREEEGEEEGAKMLTQLKGRHIFTIFLTYGLCKESP